MIKKLNILVLLLIILLSVGVVSASDDVNANNNSNSDNLAISDSYDSDIISEPASHTINQNDYSKYFDNKGNLIEAKLARPVVKDNIQGKYSLRDFFEHNHTYPTASVMYRREHIEEVRAKSDTMGNPYLGDWTQWIALLCFGDMYYLDEVTCAYRINPSSITHSGVDARRLGLAKANFKLLPAVASVLPDGYEDIKDDLNNNTAWLWFNLANAYRHLHQYFRMAGCLLICGIKNPKMLYEKLKNRDRK